MSIPYTQMQSLEHYSQQGHHHVRGWLWHSAAYMTTLLGLEQIRQNHAGHVAEIGVWQGRYLQLLGLMSRPNETILGIDSFVHSPDPKLFEASLRERFENEESLAGRLQLIKQDSTTLKPSDIQAVVPEGVRLFSVDGGHLAPEALHDLRLCSDLMTDEGIIIVDDIFNTTCPGVVEATLRFLTEEAGADFETFCICGNKMFISRRSSASYWRNFLLDLVKQFPEVSLFRDTGKFMSDLPPGVLPRFCGADVVVITWSGDYLVADDGQPVTLRLKVCDPNEVHSDQCVLPSAVRLIDRLPHKRPAAA